MRDVTPVEALDVKLQCYETYRRIQRHPEFARRMNTWIGDKVGVQHTWIAESIPVAWSPQTYEAVRHASQSFPRDAWPPLPQDCRLKLFVFPAPLLEMNVEGHVVSIDAILIGIDRALMISVTAFTRQDMNVDPVWWYQRTYGEPLTEIPNVGELADPVEVDEARLILQFVFTAWAFLDQRVSIEDCSSASRPAQRRAQRLDIDPVVHVMRFRRAEARAHEGVSCNIEWSCQWLVRGHWRNQWHPRMQRHAPVWILPHIKGPADMPLKTPAPEVWQVAR